jgi:hypothetical protein
MTDKHVYGAIFREHQKSFQVFGSFTNMEPSHLSSQPEILTEWGFKGADYPLIKIIIRWEHGKRDTTETVEFYLAVPIKEQV